jgi:hypothetical protein
MANAGMRTTEALDTRRAAALTPAGVLDTAGLAEVQIPILTVDPRPPTPLAWWLGIHGGAGESTLARLFPTIAAAQHRWPVIAGARTRVVLCARTNYWGMVAAQAACLDHYRRLYGQVDVLGLVLIADSASKPRPQLQDLLLDLQAAANGHVWRLPWVESWALGRLPSPADSRMKEVEALRLGVTAALRQLAAQP